MLINTWFTDCDYDTVMVNGNVLPCDAGQLPVSELCRRL